jgi:hypothetical protein
MPEVRVQRVTPRRLAAARGSCDRAELPATILRLLDLVWPEIRRQQLRHDHNVVLYLDGLRHIEAGVEIEGELRTTDEVREVWTPAGLAATVTHEGDYARIGMSYDALDAWCRANRQPRTGVSWEVYGDWQEDPALLRTDIFRLLEG